MLTKYIDKLQRYKTIKSLKNHSNITLESIKLGINNHFSLYPNLKNITLGKDLNFRNYIHIIVGDNAKLTIGNKVFMNNFCSINCLHEISIGENTLFGENVKLYDHNHQYERKESTLDISHSEFTYAPISIGKNCWLGSNVTVLKGVKIGDNCIIGAGCTIYKDVPENTTVINHQNLIQNPN